MGNLILKVEDQELDISTDIFLKDWGYSVARSMKNVKHPIRKIVFLEAKKGNPIVQAWLWDNFKLKVSTYTEIEEINERRKLNGNSKEVDVPLHVSVHHRAPPRNRYTGHRTSLIRNRHRSRKRRTSDSGYQVRGRCRRSGLLLRGISTFCHHDRGTHPSHL